MMIDLDAADDANITAVMAHGALNSMCVVSGTLDVLTGEWGELDESARNQLLASASNQAQLVTALLRDLVSGLPLGATAILWELDHKPRGRHLEV